MSPKTSSVRTVVLELKQGTSQGIIKCFQHAAVGFYIPDRDNRRTLKCSRLFRSLKKNAGHDGHLLFFFFLNPVHFEISGVLQRLIRNIRNVHLHVMIRFYVIYKAIS